MSFPGRQTISGEGDSCLRIVRFFPALVKKMAVLRGLQRGGGFKSARQAVEDLVGALVDDHYPCPDALAALAVWPA